MRLETDDISIDVIKKTVCINLDDSILEIHTRNDEIRIKWYPQRLFYPAEWILKDETMTKISNAKSLVSHDSMDGPPDPYLEGFNPDTRRML